MSSKKPREERQTPDLVAELWNPDGTIRDRTYGRGRGQPPKITPKVIDKIARLIIKGNYRDVAARSARISRSTLYNWIANGKKGRAAKSEQERASLEIYVHFLDTLEEAEAVGETLAIDALYRHFAKNGQVLLQFLERRYRKRWSPNADPDAPETGEDDSVQGAKGPFQVYMPAKDPEPLDEVCSKCSTLFDKDRRCLCSTQ